jgi:HEAT repeat protein
LEQEDESGRLKAVRQLGFFGSRAAEAVPALVKLLNDEAVRKAAIATLGDIGPAAQAAVPALEAADDIFANNALKKITGW